jgi:predicted nucleic acid-binding protein
MTTENLTLIDTDILIFILKKNPSALLRSESYLNQFGKLNISELTYYECIRGLASGENSEKRRIFERIINQIEVYSLNKAIYDRAAEIYVTLRKVGTPTGEFDLLIAATALEHNFTLSTNNQKH